MSVNTSTRLLARIRHEQPVIGGVDRRPRRTGVVKPIGRGAVVDAAFHVISGVVRHVGLSYWPRMSTAGSPVERVAWAGRGETEPEEGARNQSER